MNYKLSILKINYKLTAMFISLFVLLLLVYGLVPFLYVNNLSAYYLMYGDTQSLLNNGIFTLSYVKNFGFELGSPFLQGLPFTYVSALVSIILKVDPYVSNVITGILLLLLAYISMFYLLRKMDINDYVSVLFSYLFLILSINYGQAGYGTMMYAFILLPFYILIDNLYFNHMYSKKFSIRASVILFLIYSVVKTMVIFLDGYAFMISSLVSISLFIAYAIKHFKSALLEKRIRLFNYRFIIDVSSFIVSNIIAISLYKLYVPGGGSYQVMPLDFFRAQGIDVISLFIPGKGGYYFLDLFGLTKKWDAFAFYGDGSNVGSNYLGYTLIVMFVLFGFIKGSRKHFVNVILIAGAVSFVLSLGPSLKFNDTRKEIVHKTTVEFSDYLMPAKDATLNLHTGFIYKHIPGINNMRAVQRWILLFMFSLIMSCALLLTYLIDKKRYGLACCLAVLSILELQPNLYLMHKRYVANYRQAKQFDNVVDSMRRFIKPNEKVFYLSDQNDYLANYVSSRLNVMSYNVAGDKNMVLSSRYWPLSIKQMKEYREVNESAYLAMSHGVLDKLVIPYFDLRWHSYYWPPSDGDRLKIKMAKLSIFNINDTRFKYHEEKWFGVAASNSGKS
jgi:hypothetical protein